MSNPQTRSPLAEGQKPRKLFPADVVNILPRTLSNPEQSASRRSGSAAPTPLFRARRVLLMSGSATLTCHLKSLKVRLPLRRDGHWHPGGSQKVRKRLSSARKTQLFKQRGYSKTHQDRVHSHGDGRQRKHINVIPWQLHLKRDFLLEVLLAGDFTDCMRMLQPCQLVYFMTLQASDNFTHVLSRLPRHGFSHLPSAGQTSEARHYPPVPVDELLQGALRSRAPSLLGRR